MGKKISLIGNKYGKLTVIEEVKERDKQGKILYRCLCECGSYCNVKAINLTKSKTKSCGCSTYNSLIKDEDFIGKTFGYFKVISFSHINEKRIRMYKCKCDCGNEVVVNCYNLKNGRTTNCGCKRKKTLTDMFQKNIVGQKFGKLYVLEEIQKRNLNKKVIYKCLCECGSICEVVSQSLTSGHTTSCGCVLSKSNAILEKTVRDLGFSYKREYHININKNNVSYIRFDIFIPSLNVAIEYDGEQHFKPIEHFGGEEGFNKTKERDMFKNNYCKENNIKLLRIPYYEKNNIPKIIKEFLSPTTTERENSK